MVQSEFCASLAGLPSEISRIPIARRRASETAQSDGANIDPALERRRTVRLENYWLSLRWSANGPYFQDFRPERSPVPWPQLFLAHCAGRSDEIAFEHVGDDVAAVFRPVGTNLPEREWLLDAIRSHYGEIDVTLQNGTPARCAGSLTRMDGATVLYRSLLLPFVDGARKPRYLLGAITYRVERAPAKIIPWPGRSG